MKLIKSIIQSIATIAFLYAGVACSSEPILEDDYAGQPAVTIGSIESEGTDLITTKAKKTPEGTYYFGYKRTINSQPTLEFQEIKVDDAGKASYSYNDNGTPTVVEEDGSKKLETHIYWSWLALEDNGKFLFTLSNVKDDWDNKIGYDILWAKDEQVATDLKFKMTHRMAKVRLELTMEDGFISPDKIKEIYISNVKQEYKFDLKTGVVAPEGSTSPSNLMLIDQQSPSSGSGETTHVYAAILPPQDRNQEMTLTVVTNEGERYSRKLPFHMSRKNATGTGTVPLKFQQGYALNLTAKLMSAPDWEILFHGATLENWLFVGDYVGKGRESGIYTVEDLNDWVSLYNAYTSTSDLSEERTRLINQLERYGNRAGSNFNFSIACDLRITPPLTAKINTFVIGDKLTSLNTAMIHGIGKSGLFDDPVPGDSQVDNHLFNPNP